MKKGIKVKDVRVKVLGIKPNKAERIKASLELLTAMANAKPSILDKIDWVKVRKHLKKKACLDSFLPPKRQWFRLKVTVSAPPQSIRIG